MVTIVNPLVWQQEENNERKEDFQNCSIIFFFFNLYAAKNISWNDDDEILVK